MQEQQPVPGERWAEGQEKNLLKSTVKRFVLWKWIWFWCWGLSLC